MLESKLGAPISTTNVLDITSLDLSDRGVIDFTGIKYLGNLKELKVF